MHPGMAITDTFVVIPGSQNFNTPGTTPFTVPKYNTLTVTCTPGTPGSTGQTGSSGTPSNPGTTGQPGQPGTPTYFIGYSPPVIYHAGQPGSPGSPGQAGIAGSPGSAGSPGNP